MKIHTREQELEKENADLDKRLKESQLKINELSLVKKPTWKERHYSRKVRYLSHT